MLQKTQIEKITMVTEQKIASPPTIGIGCSWSLRSLSGLSTNPTARAFRENIGIKKSDISSERMKAVGTENMVVKGRTLGSHFQQLQRHWATSNFISRRKVSLLFMKEVF